MIDQSSQDGRVRDLIAKLEPDILTGQPDITAQSREPAVELSKIGEPAVDQLIQALPRSTWAHYALGLIGEEKAFQALSKELQAGNRSRVHAAAAALGTMGDPRALEPLNSIKPRTEHDPEVYRVIENAISRIERAQIGEERWLQVVREKPFEQICRVFDTLKEMQFDAAQRERGIKWHRQFVAAMPQLKFNSESEKGQAWELLGTIIYYLLNPGNQSFNVKCPEAAYCYEQCLKLRPEKNYIRNSLERIR